jgi:hypothetical protein
VHKAELAKRSWNKWRGLAARAMSNPHHNLARRGQAPVYAAKALGQEAAPCEAFREAISAVGGAMGHTLGICYREAWAMPSDSTRILLRCRGSSGIRSASGGARRLELRSPCTFLQVDNVGTDREPYGWASRAQSKQRPGWRNAMVPYPPGLTEY